MTKILCIAILAACSSPHDTLDTDSAIDAPIVAPTPDAPVAATCACETSEYCDWAPGHACGADNTAATCKALGPQLCPDLGFWVCGCDGNTYTNGCHAAARGISVAYGGPCRDPGAHVACHTSDDCPSDDAEFPQYCVDDPTDTCDPATTADCPGICAHGTYVCGPDLKCLSQTGTAAVVSPGTEACMNVTAASVENPDTPGRCIYTTRQTCASSADCGTGELCMPELNCDPATTSCPQDCVRP